MGAVAMMAVVGAVLSIAEGAAGMKPFQGSGSMHGYSLVALMAVVGAVLSIAERAAGMKPFQGSGNVHG
uniref:Uncharacterized protein n=1 Tax=Tetradesmus obliquus TaxID=3088 RepID=A0A383V6T5_TETOB|eukprot:jgi/Sobl393_1/1764/SZX60851.1